MNGVDIDAVHRRRPAFTTATTTHTHHNTTTTASMTTLAAIDATPSAAPHLGRAQNKKFAPATHSILLAISAKPGISTHDIALRMPALPMATVSKALANMRVAGYVVNHNAGGATQAAQWAATAKGLAKAAELAGDEPQSLAEVAHAASISAMAVADAAARRDTLKSMPHGGRSQAVNKTPERLAVEDCLALAGARGRTRSELCRMTGLSDDDVQRVLQHLVAAQRGDSVATPGTERHWRLLSAVARDEAARPKAAAARVCNASTKGDYLGTELQPNPGITADRFAAFLLPSLVNGVSVPPKRITAMCTGPAGPVGGGVSVNVRFAK